MANHKCWLSKEKAKNLLPILQEQAADIPHNVPAEVTYEDITRALSGRFGDHRLAIAYCSQQKARTMLSRESIQEFTANV
jgi:hypothetical protein